MHEVRGKMVVAEECLTTFVSRVRGVKFYAIEEIENTGGWWWLRAKLKRDPGNLYDRNCVEVMVPAVGIQGQNVKLGHLAKEAAEFVSPLLAAGFRFAR